MRYSIIFPTVTAAFMGTAAQADDVIADDLIVQGRTCIGETCANGEAFADVPATGVLKIKGSTPYILFEDTSSGGSQPTSDWRIQAGDSVDDAFWIENIDDGTKPFLIDGDAPSNSLYVSSDGDVGLGTQFPFRDFHIRRLDTPAIRFQQIGQGGALPYQWEILANDDGFSVVDFTSADTPLFLEAGAPDDALFMESTGELGVGTATPEGILHTKGDGVQLAYFESGDGGPVQVRFRTDSENRRFLAVNNANEVKSQIIFLDDRINFTGQTDSGANLWLSIGPNGITSQGPTCGSPCDLTFDPDVFEVPPIEVRAEYMWENMHLPAIGPTSPREPINLTEKTGGIIHELEIAHIYIEQLHARLSAQTNTLAALRAEQASTRSRYDRQIEALLSRVADLESAR